MMVPKDKLETWILWLFVKWWKKMTVPFASRWQCVRTTVSRDHGGWCEQGSRDDLSLQTWKGMFTVSFGAPDLKNVNYGWHWPIMQQLKEKLRQNQQQQSRQQAPAAVSPCTASRMCSSCNLRKSHTCEQESLCFGTIMKRKVFSP